MCPAARDGDEVRAWDANRLKPGVLDRCRAASWASSTASCTCRGEGRWPVDTYRPLPFTSLLAVASLLVRPAGHQP